MNFHVQKPAGGVAVLPTNNKQEEPAKEEVANGELIYEITSCKALIETLSFLTRSLGESEKDPNESINNKSSNEGADESTNGSGGFFKRVSQLFFLHKS